MRYTLVPVRCLAVVAALVVLLQSAPGPAAAGNAIAPDAVVRVESFSPQGYVRQVRQVVVRFSGSVVGPRGPAIVESLPQDGWAEIDEEQVFLLRLDAQARAASIEAHAYCAVDGLAER